MTMNSQANDQQIGHPALFNVDVHEILGHQAALTTATPNAATRTTQRMPDIEPSTLTISSTTRIAQILT
jgi:hypothetical protein